MQEQDFGSLIEAMLKRDPRYHRDAYLFVREGLDFTQKKVSKETKKTPRHVSGQELLEGIREYALGQYGPMTLMVFEEWGVHRCEDFGEIVFNMVENGILSKTPTDTQEDFKAGYDFQKTFREPFLPSSKTPCIPQ
jgi:uncharacterized repeat protein (TIGR04138 family)